MVASIAASAFFHTTSSLSTGSAKSTKTISEVPESLNFNGIAAKPAPSLQVKANARAVPKINGSKVGLRSDVGKTEEDGVSSASRTFYNQLPDWSMLLAAITTIFLAAEKQWTLIDWKPRRPDMLADAFGFGKFVQDGLAFRQNFSIRSYEVGADRTASIETLMNHLQETALNHVRIAGLMDDGFGATPEMNKRNLIWVVAKMHVSVEKYPSWADVVQVDTWVGSSGKNGVRRDWQVIDCQTGQTIVRATGVSALMNKTTRKLSKMPDEVRAEIGPYFVEGTVVVDEDGRKLPKLTDGTAQYVREGLTPRWGDLDVNQHVNNVKYVGWILEMSDESLSGGHMKSDVPANSVQDSSSEMCLLEPDQMVDNNLNDSEGTKGGIEDIIDHTEGKLVQHEEDGVPGVGMVFKTFEEVYDFYNQYARRVGFGTKIRRSWYSLDDGQCNKFMLTCCKEGKREYKNSERCSSYRLRLAARTDCQARIKVFKKFSDGMFHLTEVNLEHNHPVNPSMSRFFRSHKDLNDGAKKLPVMRGKGHRDLTLGENEQDHASVKSRSSFLGKDDLEALLQFLARMQNNGTNFFHLMDLDEEGYLKNVFWADGRCKTSYQYFGDVVTFDTTYLTSNYETPLVSFVGVNHHGHLVLFGCGLISDKSVEAYRWLFKSWLSCMSGSHPNGIITDHVKVIQEAAAEVFPSSCHRFCLLNIMRQMQENLGAYPEYKSIKGLMKKVVYDSLMVDDFEEEWKNMIEKYALEDNEWLKSLHENRHLWVPAFVKETFWAGMSNIQHKENMNSFFDGYIYPKTSLKQFICKYETILKGKFEKEMLADRDSFHKSPQLISKFYMEDQLRKLYTVDMFKKFQEEVKAILYCIPSLVRVDGPISIFEVREPLRMKDGNQMESKNYEVTYSSTELAVRCICCSFQMIGILCRHILSVLNFLEIYEIPAHYIFDRWRKDYKNIHVMPCFSNDLGANGPAERYDNLYKHCLKFIELGATSDGLYEYALKILSEGTHELLANDPMAGDIQPRICNPFSDKRFIGNESDEIYDLAELRQRSQPLKRRKELAEKTVKNSKKKVPPRKPIVASQNDALRIAPDTPQFETHIWTQDSINLTEQVTQPNLSIGNHFGDQHALDSQAGIRWSIQNMFQQSHIPDGPPGPWSG